MNWLRTILPALLSCLLLTACDSDGLYSLVVITEGQHEFSEHIRGDLLILGGEVVLSENTTVEGAIYLLLGKLTLGGKVKGDVSFLNGELTLGPAAYIAGDLDLGGGSFRSSPDAIIEGRVNTGAGVTLPSTPGLHKLRHWSFWLRTLVNGFLSGLIAATLVRYFPSATDRIGEAIKHHPFASGAMGVLVGIVGLSLLVTLAYTLLLIPVSILLLFLLAMAIFVGWVGLGNELGRLIARAWKRPPKPSQTAFLGMLILMGGLELLSAFPAIGGVLGIAAAVVGLGATSLTRFGLQRFVPSAGLPAARSGECGGLL
ncbi:MAG TPA: hypothetical protein VGK56_12195 [Anaerolineales bacterium]